MVHLSKTVLALGFVATAVAVCPGEVPCSGHGTCGTYDSCSCYPGWGIQSDCSERACPFGKSWLKASSGDHSYEECSGKGECDRETGLCECSEGYEGHSCQRMKCPSNCNGRGMCKTISEIDSAYTAWDADHIAACVCDPGYEGLACEKRLCKPGDDPMTTTDVDEEQEIDLSAVTAGTFLLHFTDWRGETWTTHPIDVTTATANTFQEALQAIPNQALESVSVSTTGTLVGNDLIVTVTFDSESTPGTQNILTFSDAGCNVDGCQPVYAGLTGTPVISRPTTGVSENTACAGRGKCDTESGVCKCYPGYTGEMCQTQTVIT